MKSIRRIMAAAVLAAAITGAQAQEASIKRGYTAVETMGTHAGAKVRAYSGASYGRVGYAGLDEAVLGEPGTYFGSHQLFVPMGPVAPMVHFTTTAAGTQTRAGVRTGSIAKLLRGYGSDSIIAGKHDVRAVLYHGQPLPGKASIEAFEVVSKPYKGGIATVNQLQLNKRLYGGERWGLEAFVRSESVGKFDKNTMLYGLRTTWK